jgi:hypothetical protein
VLNPKNFFIRVFTLVLLLGLPSLAHADAVSDWNAMAIFIIANAPCTAAPCGNPPPPPLHPGATALLDSAMVQAAVYDAVESYSGRFRPYAIRVPGASGSIEAAVATAAHHVLVSRFPSVKSNIDTIYGNYLIVHGLVGDAGIAVGAAAAAAIIALRANDGSFPNCSATPAPPLCDFAGGNAVGQWRPTLPAFAHMLAPWLSAVTPFTLNSPSQFRPVAPPLLTSKRYAIAYNEVKTLGGDFLHNARTTDQTNLALFYFANYQVLWNRAIRDIAATQGLNIDDSARLFALVNLAMGDAVITAWDTKLHFAFWRPITAIQQGDNDGNPDTTGDPTWLPLIPTPNYPDYTSGANNITGAATRALALFFGREDMDFSLHATNAAAPVQTFDYHRFSDVAHDVVNARIWEGIHFRFADVQARKQGRHVAQWVFGHFLRSGDADEQDDHEDEDE